MRTTAPSIIDAIQALAPDAQFVMAGDTITAWHSPDIPQPSEAAIDAKLAELKARANVPKAISPRQCRLILLQQGLLSQVEAMIQQQDEATKLTWEYALEFRRDDPLLNNLAVNLNLTSEQIDQFFIAAAQL